MQAVENALASFRQEPYRYNCAQAVCHGLGREELIESMAACGGGKAEGGLCGALYGAMVALGAPRAEQVAAAFEARTGARTCHQLKRECKVPCPDCVRIATELAASMPS